MKKHTLFGNALLLCLFVTAAVSCGDQEAPSVQTDSAAADTQTDSVVTEAVTNMEDLIPAALPESDFGGATLNFLRWADGGNFDHLGYDVDGLNGELLNDEIYQRNAVIEERFHVEIVSDWVYDTPAAQIKNEVMSGDTTHQIVSDWPARLANISTTGALIDLYTVPNLNLGAEWWDQNAIETYTVRDKMFFSTGDVVLFDKQRVFVMFFNSEMAASLDINGLYETAAAGKWTIDLFNTYCAEAVKDLDGNGKMGELTDRFGLVTSSYTGVPYLLRAAGASYSVKNTDGTHSLAIDSELTLDIIEKLGETLFDSNKTIHMEDVGAQPIDPARYIFQNNQALFMHSVTHVLRLMDMDASWGVLPQPKYDETQENYLSAYPTEYSAAIGISSALSADELEMTSVVLEAMSAVSHHTTYPAFIEDILMNKKAPDAESADMLRLIYSNLEYDMFDTFQIGGIDKIVYINLYSRKGENFVSTVEKSRSKIEKAYQKLMDQYDALES